MVSRCRFFVLALALATTPMAAAATPVQDASAFAHPATAADMIESVIDNATLRTVSGRRPQIVVLWQDQAQNVDALATQVRQKLPKFDVLVVSLIPPYEKKLNELGRHTVCVITVGLSPDVVQLVSYWSRRQNVLTVGAEADVDPLSVGLQLEGQSTLIYCSSTALADEGVRVQFLPCRPLPVDRTMVPGKDPNDNSRLSRVHARRREHLNLWDPLPNERRQNVYEYARMIQHEIGLRPKEEWINGPFFGQRPRYPFLPYYQLGRAFYLLGNCHAALPALIESQKQNLATSVAPEKTTLPQLITTCRERTKAASAFPTIAEPWTFTAARAPYWRLWDTPAATEAR